MNFDDTIETLRVMLLAAPPVHRNEWQGMDTSGSPAHATRELLNVNIQIPVPAGRNQLSDVTGASQPWAEKHFLERVSGQPLNPPPSHVEWPWAVRGNSNHTDANGKFDHTYPERFWPKWANQTQCEDLGCSCTPPHEGIRYRYGDLADLVLLLDRNPFTRQAYLPVWFPEDTGAVVKQRVPCTLGYHFIMDANWRLHVNYFIRSCDFVRHFRNDVYLAGRLLQWVCDQVNDTHRHESVPGVLTMFISSLHSFVADDRRMADASQS